MKILKKIKVIESKIELLTMIACSNSETLNSISNDVMDFSYFFYLIDWNLTKKDNSIILNTLSIIKYDTVPEDIKLLHEDIYISLLGKELTFDEFETFIKNNISNKNINVEYLLMALIKQNMYKSTCEKLLQSHSK